MAETKTSTEKKRAAARKGIGREKYGCPNKGRKYSLEGLVREMECNPKLAKFVRDLLCEAHKGDNAAAECLRSYYELTDSDLRKFCIPKKQRVSLLGCCTVPTDIFLLDVPAYVAAKARSRKR